MRNISKSFEALAALQGVSLGVEKGRVVGLIGPNGSGKSTLFDIVTGFQRADSGEIFFDRQRIDGLAPHEIARRGLVRTFQLSEGGQ
ncbi:MAG: ATP-binding cassette domain-containing protein, partial [Alphaproteobacteria bacterium]